MRGGHTIPKLITAQPAAVAISLHVAFAVPNTGDGEGAPVICLQFPARSAMFHVKQIRGAPSLKGKDEEDALRRNGPAGQWNDATGSWHMQSHHVLSRLTGCESRRGHKRGTVPARRSSAPAMACPVSRETKVGRADNRETKDVSRETLVDSACSGEGMCVPTAPKASGRPGGPERVPVGLQVSELGSCSSAHRLPRFALRASGEPCYRVPPCFRGPRPGAHATAQDL